MSIPARVHGTTNGYSNYGCRCGDCREAWRKYWVTYRRRKGVRSAEEVWAEQRAKVQHGTHTKYITHGCRCDECRAGARERKRRNRLKGNPVAACPDCGGCFNSEHGLRIHRARLGCGVAS